MPSDTKHNDYNLIMELDGLTSKNQKIPGDVKTNPAIQT
jgi:hypothetical protein